MVVDLDEVYRILLRVIQTKDTITYTDLSQAYAVQRGGSISPRGWGEHLYAVSRRCTLAKLPPISTVVVNASDNMPGDGYWGIPGAPAYKDWNQWKAVLGTVYAAKWPAKLP